jgi:VWFA-related protein
MTTARAKGLIGPSGMLLGICMLGALADVGTSEQTTSERKLASGSQVIRRRVELVTTDVTVRDRDGRFVSNLERQEFELLEDGVVQEIVMMTMSHGGRVFVKTAGASANTEPGIVLPPPRPSEDVAGRIFLLVIDDLHLNFRDTGRLRDLVRKIATELIHEGDMFGVLSTGPSSLAIDLTYDRRRLDDAISRISGAGLSPKDILGAPAGAQGSP